MIGHALVRIEGRNRAGLFVAGVCIEDGRVVRYAPTLFYMKGWGKGQVFVYARKRGWTATMHFYDEDLFQ